MMTSFVRPSTFASLIVFSAVAALDSESALSSEILWKKHLVAEAKVSGVNGVSAFDWDRDGQMDVISSMDSQVIVFRGPDWKPNVVSKIIQGRSQRKVRSSCIHSCLMDVDNDGDMDFVGSNSTVFWLECPADPFDGSEWVYRVVDDEINGTHCLITGDVDRDGKLDLIANSGRASGTPFTEALTWLEIPEKPHQAKAWIRHVYASSGQAPRNSHYAGFGDVNGDGRPDIAYGAKGIGDPVKGGWFAWWEQPATPTGEWKKHLLADVMDGATNILPADLNQDGFMDYFATRGHNQGVLWFKGPNFKPIEIDPEILNPHSLALADLDEDGDVDAVTCSKDSNGLTVWYENSGNGRFTRHIIDRGQGSYDTRTTDMDGDGDLDILIAGHSSKNVVWYENQCRP